MINTSDVKDIYSLSPMQRGMLFHTLKDKENLAYFDQTTFQIEGEICVESLEKSFNELIRKYDVLRTIFLYQKLKEPMQVVLKERTASIYYEDFSKKSELDKTKSLRAAKQRDRDEGFDLSRDILMRLSLLKVAPKQYELVISSHHIIIDGWCTGILYQDLFYFYQCFVANKPIPTEKAIPYSRYIRWLEEQDEEEAKTYWSNYLQDFEGASVIPKENSKGEKEVCIIDKVTFHFDKKLSEELVQVAKASQVTISTLFQTMWGILLQKYNNSQEAIFGSVISGRSPEIPDVEKIVGIFINTIPVRIRTLDKQTFKELLMQVQEASVNSEKYNYQTLADIQAVTGSNHALIHHIVAFENFPVASDSFVDSRESDSQELKVVNVIDDHEKTNFDFNVQVQMDTELLVKISYNQNLYNKSFIDNIFNHLQQIAQSIIHDLDIQVDEIAIVSKEEKDQLVSYSNPAKSEFPMDKTIHQLFEEQVLRNPERTAIVFKGQSLTYRQLNEKANQLAWMLRKREVKPNDIVAIMAEHSLEMVAGVIGILKAGAAYLPIDPSYPEKRIAHMLQDSKAEQLLIQPHLNMPQEYKGSTLWLAEESWAKESTNDLPLVTGANDLAYIIYTSGSTGLPKGVMVEHHSLVNLVMWHNDAFSVTQNDQCTKLAGFGFDASVWETFPPLIQGATLHVLDESRRGDIYALHEYFEKNAITISFLPTQLAEQFMELTSSTLRVLLIGGDRAQKIKKTAYQIINNYGPTENAVVTTSGQLHMEQDVFPIGKPITNHSVYILDQKGHLQPIGVPGELCVSGTGLARGYLNQPELTVERFVDNPFVPGERMYRTGDLVRWKSDGSIEYLGRIDEQVKIRGYRIELGEIEAKLLDHPSISEALVVARNDEQGYTYLCAYVVASGTWSVSSLREHLIETLPEYMVPAYMMEVEKMPLTANGKVDKRALPVPDRQRMNEYEPPSTETEEKLVQLFQEILGLERVGTKDHFFELGGHSLKAMMLVSRMHKELGVDVQLNEMFARPTVKDLAAYIDQMNGSAYTAIQPAEEQPYYPVSFAQRRMYVVQQMRDSETTSYNMPFSFELKGKLHLDKLRETLQILVLRHESLRTSFHMIDENLVQKINKDISWELEVIEARESELQSKLEEFIRPFNLSEAPLFRARLFCLNPHHYLLSLDMHHIISDGVSMNLFLQEFMTLYQGEALPALAIQYKDYALWQQSDEQRSRLKEQENYWLHRFSDELPTLELPTDYPRPAIQQFDGDEWTFEINADLLAKVKQICSSRGTTLYMTLLAAYQVFLARYTGQEDIIVGSPIAGRSHADLENIIGMFVNTLALRGQPKADQSFLSYLNEVKETVFQAYANAEYPFEELIEKLNLERDMSRHPLFDTLFSLQNIEMSEFQMSNVEIFPYETGQRNAKFSLSWLISEGESLYITIEYSTKCFKQETIQRMASHFEQLLAQIVAHPEENIGHLELVTDAEKNILLEEFNLTKVDYPREKTIQELFEEQVVKNPDQIALICGEEQFTYTQLNVKFNQLAHVLRREGVQPNQVIGLITDRSLAMIVGIFGILKAGGSYLPIDPTYPEERIQYMLEDSQTHLLLVQQKDMVPAGYQGEVLIVEDDIWRDEPVSNIELINQPQDLAYVMYTSGSTGKPKGNLTTHRNIVKTVCNNGYIEINAEDRFLQLSNYAFDGSTFDIFSSLLHGATLVLVPKEVILNPVDLVTLIRQKHITVSFMTTSLFNALVELDLSSLKNMRKIAFGGEKASFKHVEKALDFLGNGRLVNGYGPTETTVFATTYTVDERIKEWGIIPIGRPLHNTTVHILSSEDKLQPIGVIGELCVSGEGLARGYLNLPDLTMERFVENPFVPGERMYRTGDLARWLPDGVLEYVGRKDEQVKIRGHRIELSEIETRILEHPAISETVLIAKQNEQGSSYLCAYIVAHDQWNVGELRKHVRDALPEHMVPSYFIGLDKLPLTSNSKVDKRALPEPEGNLHLTREIVAPKNESERQLVNIVAEVLGLEASEISITDNLFELGGHSLTILRILAKVHTLHWKLEMKDFYNCKNFEEVASKVSDMQDNQELSSNGSIFKQGEKKPIPVVPVHDRQKEMEHVLLLGSTGFLGIHLLHELLQKTEATIHCVIRAKDDETAMQRLRKKIDFYFTSQYSSSQIDEWFNRIQIIHGDITQAKFGLEAKYYESLGTKVDTVIHTAALVKHYGYYEEFERANVHGTQHVVTFCLNNTLPLHYVSTLSVSGTSVEGATELVEFTERDFYVGQNYESNVYLRSKFEAEAVIVNGLENGLDARIYRVGNLTGRFQDGWFQENINENMFYLLSKAFLELGGFDQEIMQGMVDLTPIDICAEAIIHVITSKGIQERVFHLQNPHFVTYDDMYRVFEELGFSRRIQSREDVTRELGVMMSQGNDKQFLAGLMTIMLKDAKRAEQFNVAVDSSRTLQLLEDSSFTYPVPDGEYMRKLAMHMIKVGFVTPNHTVDEKIGTSR
ncbi:non-ribosomal peptide synthetase [Brevibacillus laterosporus DSM 25]|nr:non-ribosomal peptide synthetase [Brevibacillus laterosporus]ATO50304.1 non-ribosomal peptide synthetase [Brevibacillus laterosporus DSM 25]